MGDPRARLANGGRLSVSPDHVLTRLDDYVKEFELTEDDERWLMLDTDHWVEPNHIANFNHVCTQATQKGFKLCSNPCFEIWLLLHLTDLDAGEGFKRCKEVVQRLKQLGKYSKRRVYWALLAGKCCRRGWSRRETRSVSWRPLAQKTGSHAYKIVRKLLPGLTFQLFRCSWQRTLDRIRSATL